MWGNALFVLLSAKSNRELGQPGNVADQGGVADKGHCVDQRVRDDHRGRAAPAQEQRAEDDAHDRGPDEAAEALVQVIRTAQGGADRYGGPRIDAKLAQPGQQVTGDKYLFEQSVLESGEEQDGVPPTDSRIVLRDDVQCDARLVRDEVQAEATAAD